jgi:hypothetical protein
MKKIWTSMLLAFACIAALAQVNVCNVPDPKVWRYYTEIGAPGSTATIPCGPPPRGTGVNPSFRGDERAIMFWHYCKLADNRYYPVFGLISWTSLQSVTYVGDLLFAYNAPDLIGGITAFAKKYYVQPLATSTDVLPTFCKFQREMYVSTPGAPPPPPLTYTVTPYLTASYRATYPITQPFNGTRSLTSNGRVAIKVGGVPTVCDCQAGQVLEPGTNGVVTTYCSVGGAPLTVANCSAQ